MELIEAPLPGVLLLQPTVHGDDRGTFVETFNRATMAGLGVDLEFVQDNQSMSVHPGTVRGLHLQLDPYAQGKLVRVLRGSILDVAVDLRPGSPTYAHHCTVTLDATEGRMFWVPPGFAHGFCTLEADTVVFYKCTALYAPAADRSLRWNDPRLGIDWPVDPADAVLSAKDAAARSLDEIEPELLGAAGGGVS